MADLGRSVRCVRCVRSVRRVFFPDECKKMARSFLLPMKPEHDYIQAKIYDLKNDTDYFLIVDRNVVPSFNYKYFNEDREIVIYVKGREYLMKKYSPDESIKVELFDDEGIDAVICAIKRLFPCAPICAFVLCKLKKNLSHIAMLHLSSFLIIL